ncbi:tyrosine-type recombinase/integrase [Rahnella sp. PD12R]|nr:tyrosine-type recombinase/integrase [Rahnella sp. PD12R]
MCRKISKSKWFGYAGYLHDLARKILKRVAPEIPAGQATHVFRHTFASHFMANGGNMLVLQRILGHSSINQTMVYAHFSPDHLADAATLNPLVNLD